MRTRLGRFLALALFLPIVGLVLFIAVEGWLGGLAVKMACERDGGISLETKTATRGLLFNALADSNCIQCIRLIASWNIQYVDYFARNDGHGELFPVSRVMQKPAA